MFINFVNTWTIYVLFSLLITHFCSGASLGDTNELPKSMYDALVRKCPNLETTGLKENEIFTTKCSNWTEINATKSFSKETKDNVECLLFYESLVSFCTSMGDNLPKVQGIIPTSTELQHYNYTLDTVCLGKYSLYPVNKTEHNISSLIPTGTDCIVLCLDVKSDFTDKGVSDVCKFTYYFTNLDVNKFIHKLETVQKKVDANPGQPAKTEEKPVIKNETVIVPNDVRTIKNETPERIIPAVKPEQTVRDDHVAPVRNDIAETDNKNIKQQIQTDTKVNIPEPSGVEVGLQIGGKPAEASDAQGINSVNNAPLLHQQPEAHAEEGNGQPESVPEKEKKPETHLDNPEADLQVIPEYENDDKPGNVDRTDPDMPDDNDLDVDQDDGNVRPNAVRPEKNNEQKSETKKVKPSTVEDEGVSFTSPEDDMDGDSYFFSYFTVIMCLFIVGYVGYHNRQKILALLLEGKKGRRTGRSRRPNSANYHKLDTNLEEAISSNCTKNASNVIY